MLQDMVWTMFGYEKGTWASCESICKVFFNSITAAASHFHWLVGPSQ
jgi:hypothetical protein